MGVRRRVPYCRVSQGRAQTRAFKTISKGNYELAVFEDFVYSTMTRMEHKRIIIAENASAFDSSKVKVGECALSRNGIVHCLPTALRNLMKLSDIIEYIDMQIV